MHAYSVDLRMRIIAASLAEEGSPRKLAERYQVSERWVRRLLRQWRDTGSCAPRPHGGGRPRRLGPDHERLLRQALAETPDASLDELRQRCTVNGSRMCVARTLQRWGITRKKSRSRTPNSRIPGSNANGGPGGAKPGTSSPHVSSFSTKPMRKPV